MTELSRQNREASEIAAEADRGAGYGADAWRDALPDRALLEALVRDPDEAYAIFRDACHDRGLSAERVLVEMLDKLMLRVAVLEEACAGQIRDHGFRKTIAEHRTPNGNC